MNNASIIDIINGLFWIAMGVFSFLCWRKRLPTNMQETFNSVNPLPSVFWIIAAVVSSLNGIYIIVKVLRDIS